MTNKNILKESLTVNENVKQIASEIKNEILMRLKKQSIAMAKETNDLIKQGIFTYFTNGKLSIKSFKVKYYVTLYPSIDKYNDALYKSALNLNSECDYERAVMTLRLAMINGELTRESYGIIEHETNHFLQNSLGQTKNETLYDKIVQQCKDGSKITKRLAYALYLSLNSMLKLAQS